MNTTIWKYQVLKSINSGGPTFLESINLPINSKILSVENQYEGIALYVHVNPEEKKQSKIKIWIHGTGHETSCPEGSTFLGTVKLAEGKLMFHVFYKKVK